MPRSVRRFFIPCVILIRKILVSIRDIMYFISEEIKAGNNLPKVTKLMSCSSRFQPRIVPQKVFH